MFMAKWSLLPLAIMLAVNIAGCSGKGAEPQGGNTLEKVGESVVDVNKPVELVFYSTNGDSPESFDDKWGNALRKKFPNWTITYIQNKPGARIEELFAAGTKIDVYFESVAVFNNGKEQDLWYDMTDLIKKHNIDLNRLEPTAMDQMKLLAGTQVTGLPVSIMTMGLYYNKEIFDKFGIEYPKDGITWDEVIATANKITRNEGGTTYLGFVDSPLHIVRLNQLGFPLVDPQTNQSTLSDERWKKMMGTVLFDTKQGAAYKDWIQNENKGNKGKMGGQGNFTSSRNAAMFAYLSNLIQTSSKDLENMNWDVVSYPAFKENPGVGTQAYPIYMGITKQGEHKNESMEAIKFLLSDEYQLEASRKGNLTSLKSDDIRKMIGQDGMFKDKNLKSFYYNKFAPAYARTIYDGVESLPYAKAAEVLLNQMDINTMLRTAEEESNKKITEKINTAAAK
jgi:ABC-type glycerol-3-phosphate transport system substrate-binding protein